MSTQRAQLASFGPGIKVLSAAESIDLDLGPLTDLKGTWVGKPFDGWNVIAVPGPKGTQGFTLEVIPFEETLTFKPVVVAGNRGPFVNDVQEEQHIVGLLYEQVVTSVCDTDLCRKMGFGPGTEIHAERGLFLNVTDFNSDFDVARLSTVPHGNSILALGKSSTNLPGNNDFFGTAFIKPTTVDPTKRPPLGYTETQYNKQQFPGEFDQTDPNTALRKTLGDSQITRMTTLDMSTKNGTGGILNIPFIQSNVDATDMHSIFWIEHLKNPVAGEKDILQLQYTQTINLVFPATGDPLMIIWPHVTVNTLRKEQ